MKLTNDEQELIFDFLNSAKEVYLYDKNPETVMKHTNLKENALTLNWGTIETFNSKDFYLKFEFKNYEPIGRNTIYFFKDDGYVLSVVGDSNLVNQLYDLKNN